jgi:hypothetical protein
MKECWIHSSIVKYMQEVNAQRKIHN